MDQQADDSKKLSIRYQLRPLWEDVHLPTLLVSVSSLYLMECLVYHPFDVIRTKIQVDHKKFDRKETINLIRRLGPRGTKMMILLTYTGLYVGFWPATLGYMPGNGVYLLTYNFARDKLQKFENKRSGQAHDGKQAVWVSFAAGATADTISNCLYCPMEIITQRLYVQGKEKTNYKNAFDAARQIYHKEGFRGYYRGFGATLMTNVPASAIWWSTYEYCKELFSEHLFQTHLTNSTVNNNNNDVVVVSQHKGAQWCAGLVAGVTMTFLTNPMDVIKTRLQTQHFQLQQGSLTSDKLYSNSYQAVRQIIREEGFRALGKGVRARMLYSAFFSSFSGVLYEFMMGFSSRK